MPLRLLPILLFIAACAWAQPPAIPDTPAGHTLQAWLDAFNSGDPARIQAYLTKYEPTNSMERTMAFRDQTGGVGLLCIDKGDPHHVGIRVKKKGKPTTPERKN